MKKVILALLAVVLCFLAVGCGDDKKENEQKELNKIISTFILESETFASDEKLESKLSSYDITWTISESEFAKIEKNEDGDQVIRVTQGEEWSPALQLTATIKGVEYPELTASKTFEINIKPKAKYIAVTVEEFLKDAEKAPLNSTVRFSGTIYAMIEGKGFWVVDNSGYTAYVYMNADPVAKGYKLGSSVTVIGKKTVYYSMLELTDPQITVDKAGDGTYDYSKMKQTISIDDFVKKTGDFRFDFGKIYSVEGFVIDDPNGKYTYALKSNVSNESVVFYDSVMTEAMSTSVKGFAADNKYVKFDCLLWDYHSSNFVRILPMSEITTTEVPEITDEQKLNLGKLTVNGISKEVSADVTLPTTVMGYNDVKITWTSNKEDVLTSAGVRKEYSNKENIEVVLTATIQVGETSEKVEVKVQVVPALQSTILNVVKALLESGETSKYFTIKGKVIALDNSKYFYIADATGVVYARTKADSVDPVIEVGKAYKLIIKTTVYYNSSKEITPQLNVLVAEAITDEITVCTPVEVTIADLSKKCHVGESQIASAEIKAISQNAWYGQLIKVTCYVSVRTSGTYVNAYLASANDLTSAAAYYQHTSLYQDEVKALDGKQVTIIAPMYGYSASYGWRLGTYISIEEVK